MYLNITNFIRSTQDGRYFLLTIKVLALHFTTPRYYKIQICSLNSWSKYYAKYMKFKKNIQIFFRVNREKKSGGIPPSPQSIYRTDILFYWQGEEWVCLFTIKHWITSLSALRCKVKTSDRNSQKINVKVFISARKK